MGKINSRQKGARGEREFAEELRKAGHEARRGRQFSGSVESPDVVTSLPFHFEVKRTESLSLYVAMDQAVRDSGGRKVPVVAHKRNGKRWLVALHLDDFLTLVETGNPLPVRKLRRKI
jgi:Holliday junction resolvase